MSPRYGYACRHTGCTYTAVVQSLVDQHERTCPMRAEEEAK